MVQIYHLLYNVQNTLTFFKYFTQNYTNYDDGYKMFQIYNIS